MIKTFRPFALAFGAALMVAALWPQASRAEYPDKPITLVCSFGAGGSSDTLARGWAKYWEPIIGVPIRVVNKPGAGTVTGNKYFLAQPDDGYTLLVGASPHMTVSIIRGVDYTIDDFALIAYQQFDPVNILVRSDSPFQSLEEVIEYAEQNPGELSYGTTPGGPSHVVASALFDGLGLDVRFVPYQSGDESDMALIGGHVDVKFGSIAGDISALGDEGRSLAVAADERFVLAPDVPTFDEVLGDRVEIPKLGSGRFLAAHASFREKYPDQFNALVESYKKLFDSPEYKAHLEDLGLTAVTSFTTPEAGTEFHRNLSESMYQYKDIILGE